MLHIQEDNELVPVRSDLKPKPLCGAPQRATSSGWELVCFLLGGETRRSSA